MNALVLGKDIEIYLPCSIESTIRYFKKPGSPINPEEPNSYETYLRFKKSEILALIDTCPNLSQDYPELSQELEERFKRKPGSRIWLDSDIEPRPDELERLIDYLSKKSQIIITHKTYEDNKPKIINQ